ncbi:MAG: hypothetical protein AAGA59_19930 [Actinomycetota bacterium]
MTGQSAPPPRPPASHTGPHDPPPTPRPAELPPDSPTVSNADGRTTRGWTVQHTTGDAGPFHQRPVPEPAHHEVWVHEVVRPALVLGSTQSEALLDLERAAADGVEVCRRRSGGGIVPLVPGADCWVDVIVPRHSPLWDDDVGRAFAWLGRAWADTLRHLRSDAARPGPEPEVYDGPLLGGAAGRLICFASLGPGEVTVGSGKVVGVSQRRTRIAARFQSVAVDRWRPEALGPYVRSEALTEAGVDLSEVAAGLPEEASSWRWPAPVELAAELCAHLPAVPPTTDDGGDGRSVNAM